MGWICKTCLCSVLTGSVPCPKCGKHRPGYIPSCSECGRPDETTSNVYLEGCKDPIRLCNTCKALLNPL